MRVYRMTALVADFSVLESVPGVHPLLRAGTEEEWESWRQHELRAGNATIFALAFYSLGSHCSKHSLEAVRESLHLALLAWVPLHRTRAPCLQVKEREQSF